MGRGHRGRCFGSSSCVGAIQSVAEAAVGQGEEDCSGEEGCFPALKEKAFCVRRQPLAWCGEHGLGAILFSSLVTVSVGSVALSTRLGAPCVGSYVWETGW